LSASPITWISRASSAMLLLLTTLCGMWFGLCMTAYILFVPGHPYRLQLVCSVIKVPLLLLVSLLLAFVPMVAINHLTARLPTASLWRVLLGGVATTALVLVPAGLVVLAFCTKQNYTLVVLCSYAAFSIAGLAGVLFVARTLRSSAGGGPRRLAFVAAWALCFGLIAAHVGWSIRPFVGWTGQDFTLFRSDPTRMYEQIYWEVFNLFHGGGAGFPPAEPTSRPA
jgi:hypothetical protein